MGFTKAEKERREKLVREQEGRDASGALVGVRPVRSHATERVRAQILRRGDPAELYRFERAERVKEQKKGGARSSHARAMQDARRMLDAENDAAAAARKGGRPKRLPFIDTSRRGRLAQEI